ncbi:PBP1A family penicillin-binding protein [Rhizobiaceae bacterium]|nr:PBP1A family penicillin-binding protein [Rhizobiaceae bacterium]
MAKKRVEPGFETAKPVRKAKPRKAAPKRASKKAASGKRRSFNFARFTLYWGTVVGIWGAIGVACIVAFYAVQLPSADTWAVPERPPNLRILASDGSHLANRGVTGGGKLRLEEMSPHIPQAVIAIEDRRFHSHFGFDPIGFTRAMVRNLMAGRAKEGGSTITQQLAKNLFLSAERNMGRKVQELVLAGWLEAKFTKAEILELYLNRVYFGSGATGVDAAARRYFGKSARDVTVGEAAMLAGLLKAPSRDNPARDPKAARARAQTVIAGMQREGFVEPGAVDLEQARPGDNARHFRSGPEHYIADAVARDVDALIGPAHADLVVRTTIDRFALAAAQQTLTDALDGPGAKANATQAALVSLAPDGAIRAMIGGRDYAISQFDRATQARRQPGSAFKPFVYLTALEDGMTPNTIRTDAPVQIGAWMPRNHDGKFRGDVTMRDAFAASLNTVSVDLTRELSPRRVAATAARLGIVSPMEPNVSLALGTSDTTLLELAGAYVPFANGGLAVTPHLIVTIHDSSGRLLYERAPSADRRVVSGAALYGMVDMLSATVSSGTGRAARLGSRPVGGKTGTTQKFRDALFVGTTAQLVTAIWFGNDDGASMKSVSGGGLPAQTFATYMKAALTGEPELPFPMVAGAQPMASITTPTFRPASRFAQLRDRMTAAVEKQAERQVKRTILELLTGR